MTISRHDIVNSSLQLIIVGNYEHVLCFARAITIDSLCINYLNMCSLRQSSHISQNCRDSQVQIKQLISCIEKKTFTIDSKVKKKKKSKT